MRKIILSATVAAILALSAAAKPQQSNSTQTTAPSDQPDSLAAASRKARDQKKDAPKKSAKVYTNDDMPTAGGISTVGGEAPPAAVSGDTSGTANGDKASDAKAAPDEEKTWRDKFTTLHHKLDQDQSLLDVDQRELSVDQLQYYGGNPNAGYQDQASQKPMGEAYTKKLAEIDQKKKDIEADKQAIADAEDDLRKAGGDPGWAR